MEESERKRVVSGNEALYRDINEIIEGGQWPGESGSRSFRCECARLGCAELIELTPAEYEAVRAGSRTFVLVRGHEDPSVEEVVDVQPRYVIVEKRGRAGRLAEASDPRS